MPSGAERIITDQKLDYLGETVIHGRRCHRVRSWAVTLPKDGFLSPIREWSIDATTLLPVRIEMIGLVAQTIDYVHTNVNKPIPDEVFKPEAGAGVQEAAAEPLQEGYLSRFLRVNDGSSGRISVRWGMQGPKGTRSGGLN
jgi:hypothetical protein